MQRRAETDNELWCGAALIGKHRSGRLLDGRTHDEVPEVSR